MQERELHDGAFQKESRAKWRFMEFFGDGML